MPKAYKEKRLPHETLDAYNEILAKLKAVVREMAMQRQESSRLLRREGDSIRHSIPSASDYSRRWTALE